MTLLYELTRHRWAAGAALTIAGVLFAPGAARAQNAVVGALGTFDAAKVEGKGAHGFEVQMVGTRQKDLMPAWCGNKYNCPVVVPYATGVYVRYVSPYDSVNHIFTATTENPSATIRSFRKT